MTKRKCQSFINIKTKKMCGLPAVKRVKDNGLNYLVCKQCSNSYEPKYLFNI